MVWRGLALPETSKRAGWLEKSCRGAKPSMELPDGLHFFTRAFLRLPCITIKYVSEGPSNRSAVFLVLLSARPLFWGPAKVWCNPRLKRGWQAKTLAPGTSGCYGENWFISETRSHDGCNAEGINRYHHAISSES